MTLSAWMDSNLATQGYCLAESDRHNLAIGLRFPTAVCLVFVAVGVALQSALLLAVLAVIGAIAGVARRHPFDHVWNHGVRRLFRAPEVPPTPVRRRHAFKVAAVLLAGVAALFASGLTTAALVVGAAVLAACTAVTVLNFCIPSVAMSLWERRRRRAVIPA